MAEQNQETPESVFTTEENLGDNPEQNTEEQNPQPSETPAKENAPSPDSIFADQLGSIKNEDGVQKYSNVADALKGAAHAQEYIQQLKQQLDQEKQKVADKDSELQQYKGINDVLNGSQEQQGNTTSESLDEQKVAELFERKLTEREQQQVAKNNRDVVNNQLVETFGDTKAAKQAFEEKAQELGMTPQDLTALAEKSPKAVTSYFAAPNRSPNVEGSRRTDSLKPEENIDYNIFSSGRKKGNLLKAWNASRPE